MQALLRQTGWLNTVQSTALLSATLRAKRTKQDMCMSRGIFAISAREKAQAVTKSGLCLEEYLGVTSDYKYAEDQNCSSLNTSDTQSSQADGYYQDNTNYDYQY